MYILRQSVRTIEER